MRARRTFGFILISAFSVVFFASSCARQGEGERCDVASESNDCESGLECKPKDQLDGIVDRCCPPGDSTPSDPRCFPSSGTGGTGGTSDAAPEAQIEGAAGAGTGGSGGVDAGSEASSAGCNYNSDCPAGLVCGPQGRCQTECQADRDCSPNQACVSGKCTGLVDAIAE